MKNNYESENNNEVNVANQLLIESIKKNESGYLPGTTVSVRVGFDDCKVTDQNENSRLALADSILSKIKKDVSSSNGANILYLDTYASHQDVLDEKKLSNRQVLEFAQKGLNTVVNLKSSKNGDLIITGGIDKNLFRLGVVTEEGSSWKTLRNGEEFKCNSEKSEVLLAIKIPNLSEVSQTKELWLLFRGENKE